MKGFTILEIIIVLGLTVAIAGISLPYYSAWQGGLLRQNEVVEIGEWLRTVQVRAEVAYNKQGHGLKFMSDDNKFIIYQGENYEDRISSYDQEAELADDIGFTFNNLDSDINFTMLATSTRRAGSIGIAKNGEQIGVININQARVVSWNIE